jgi:hypothetical protein
VTWTGRPDLYAGAYPTGAQLEAILDQIASLTDPGWTDWSSSLAWTASGTAPALGDATRSAEYRRAAGSDMVDLIWKITFGGTSTFGTGVYFFSLPFTAHANYRVTAVGTALATDTGVAEYAGVVKIESGGTTMRIMPASNSGDSVSAWGQTAPFTFASGDVIGGTLRYRVA